MTIRICSRSLNFIFTHEISGSKSSFPSFTGSLMKLQKLGSCRSRSQHIRICQFPVQFYSTSNARFSGVNERAELERNLRSKMSAKLTNWDPRTSNNGQPSKIYEGMLNSQIKSVKYFSFTTTTLGLVMQPMIYQKIGDESLGLIIACFGMVGFFTYATPFLIHWVAKRYVTELIYEPKDDSYTATTYSFFLQRNQLKFKLEDITVPQVPGLFTTILVKKENGNKVPLFLADVSFIEPKHYGRFMGYDKPIDFELSADDLNLAIESKKKSKT